MIIGFCFKMNKILVVDDDVDILTVVQLVLDSHGFEVVAISKWQQIYSQIESFKPDLILLDVSLGSQDGRNICRQLKTDTATKKISIVLFSANHNVQKSIPDCFADMFISKPFDIDDLIEGINNQLLQSSST